MGTLKGINFQTLSFYMHSFLKLISQREWLWWASYLPQLPCTITLFYTRKLCLPPISSLTTVNSSDVETARLGSRGGGSWRRGRGTLMRVPGACGTLFPYRFSNRLVSLCLSLSHKEFELIGKEE